MCSTRAEPWRRGPPTRSAATSTSPLPTWARRPWTPMPEAAALELDGVDIRYGSVTAVRELTLRLGRSEIVGLIGPNGAGKSTTLHAIMGLLPVHQGEIRLNAQPLRRRSAESIARAGIALVPEGRRIFGDFTVEENLRLGLAARRRAYMGDPLAPAFELFPILQEFRRRQAGVLSGGQQQQLAIGRALVSRPDILLLDEPSLGLAPLAVDGIFKAFTEIRELGTTILLIEQRAQRTVALANRTHVLVGGELRMTLGPADAENTDKIIGAYLASLASSPRSISQR